MACRDWDNVTPEEERHWERERQTSSKLDLVTRIACSALSLLDCEGFVGRGCLPDEVEKWWKDHQIKDKQRKEWEEREEKRKKERERKAKVRKDVLSKLTPEEREAF